MASGSSSSKLHILVLLKNPLFGSKGHLYCGNMKKCATGLSVLSYPCVFYHVSEQNWNFVCVCFCVYLHAVSLFLI